MKVITDTPTLNSFCERLSRSKYITVDTEFMRDKTYWSQLCLVQLANEDVAAVVDMLAVDLNPEPIFKLMIKSNILKVFHSARQDLEIFFKLMGSLPAPIFDTQVAAMVCGFGDAVGYETLVRELTEKTVDKSLQFTNWSRRPLSDHQIEYALGDVTHLRRIYVKLDQLLDKNNRRSWLNEELSKLNNVHNYTFLPEEAWQRIKIRSSKPRFLGILKEIAAWRETEAQNRNTPRNRILKDESLIDIAHHAPTTINELFRTRGLGQKRMDHTMGTALLNAIQEGLIIPNEKLPKIEQAVSIPKGVKPIADLLKVLLKLKCDKHEVAQKLIASSEDIEKIAAFGDDAQVPALNGWRHKIFGRDALKLRSGRITLVVNENHIELSEFDG